MTANTWNEPFLPWVESENDRRFKRILLICILLFGIFGGIMPLLPVPEVAQKPLKDVSPRLAKLILDKQKKPVPPPPVVKPKQKKPVKKKTAKKKKAAPKKKKKPAESARKKAQRSGLLAMQDELADLREQFDVSSLKSNKPLQKKGAKQAESLQSNVLTAKAKTGSGGINTRSLSRSTGGGSLAGRKSTQVSSKIGTSTGKQRRTGSGAAARGEEEIERVFQKNKGAIFSLYNRELRKDPSLQGKVVLEITITPDGRVSACRIISSELNHPALERKLVARVKLFRFARKNVAPVTVSYPIDFLPS